MDISPAASCPATLSSTAQECLLSTPTHTSLGAVMPSLRRTTRL
jgi:hypothetical protein